MTVETTSFLSSGKITSNGSEKSAKFLRNHKNVIIFLLAIILLLFCVSASLLQVWILNRMSGMQQEIDQLKSDVGDLRKNIGFDDELFDDLSDFDKKYNQNDIKEEIELDRGLPDSEGKVKFDDVGEDEEETDFENSEEEGDNYEAIHSGFGDSYDEEDEEQYDLDSLEDATADDTEKKDDDNNIYKDMTRTRKTRSIAGLTDQGVPIVEESYADRRNKTQTPSDDYVASILKKNERNPKLKLTWDGQRKFPNSRREFHERHNTRHHHRFQEQQGRFAFAAAPVHHTFAGSGPKINATNPAPIQSRSSRVMHVEDKSKAFKQVLRKDQLAKLHEARQEPERWAPQPRRRTQPLRKNLELKNGRKMKITAVHYEADSSSLALGRHEYQGNNKVKLNKNEYIHWQPADWTNSHGMDRYFTMDPNGVLTVKDHGLFLIYAQVFYSDDHDVNGYVIELNNRVQFQCTTMTHTTSRVTKINSCYTSGLVHLKNGDNIQLRDIGNHRSVLLEPSKSFFGLIKINVSPNSIESSEVESFSAKK